MIVVDCEVEELKRITGYRMIQLIETRIVFDLGALPICLVDRFVCFIFIENLTIVRDYEVEELPSMKSKVSPDKRGSPDIE